MAETPTIYEWAGGTEAFQRWLDRFYDLVEEDGTLLGLFGALATSGTPPVRVLKPDGAVTLAGGEQGLHVSDSERHAAVAQFMRG